MGLFSSITKIFTGGQKAKAAKQAADVEQQQAQKVIDLLNGQFQQTQTNMQPWLTAGTSALGAQSDLLGLNGDDAQATSIQGLQNSPLFQSLMRNGTNTVLANASATGGLRGGNVQSSLANFGSDTLANVIQNQLSNLGGISGQGLTTATNEGNLGAANANSVGQQLTTQGQAAAGGILGKLAGHLEQDSGVSGLASTLAQAAMAAMGGVPGGSNMASQALKFI